MTYNRSGTGRYFLTEVRLICPNWWLR